MIASPETDVDLLWPIPVRPWLWRTLMVPLIGLLAFVFVGTVVASFLDTSTTWSDDLRVVPEGVFVVLLTMTLSRRGLERLRQAKSLIDSRAAKIVAPITDVLGELVARLVMIIVTILLLVLAVGAPLGVLYGLVRFVKWAWNN